MINNLFSIQSLISYEFVSQIQTKSKLEQLIKILFLPKLIRIQLNICWTINDQNTSSATPFILFWIKNIFYTLFAKLFIEIHDESTKTLDLFWVWITAKHSWINNV